MFKGRGHIFLCSCFFGFLGLANSAFGYSEQVAKVVNLGPGESVRLRVSGEPDSLIGWRLVIGGDEGVNLSAVEQAASCPDQGCALLTSIGRKFAVGSRFGAMGRLPTGSPELQVQSLASFPMQIEIIVGSGSN